MKLAAILVTTALFLWSGAALAAPGDLVTVQGTVTQQRDTALVVQDASGKTFYIDARPIANLGTLAPGQSVTVVGTQGGQPDLVTALSVEAATRPGDDHVASGWRLPRSHTYEQYNPERGQYQPADVNAVPGLIERGTWVFDRTAGVWVNHPGVGGRNPQYLATATSGATTAASAPAPGSGWRRIHGQVQQAQGSQLVFRTDDGRTLNVDMHEVSANVQRALTPNEGATIIGFAGAKPNEFRARYVQQDSSDPSRGGRVAQPPAGAGATPPAASPGAPDQKAWQRIHGTIESISGRQVQLRADDGKPLRVDVSAVSQNVVQALTVGEGVTVIGHFGADRNHLTAQYVQQDRSGGAASPKTAPKAKGK